MSHIENYFYPEVANLIWRDKSINGEDGYYGLELKFHPTRKDLHEIEIPENRIRILFRNAVVKISANYLDLFSRRITKISDATYEEDGNVCIWYENDDSDGKQNEVKITCMTTTTNPLHRIFEIYENRADWAGLYPVVLAVNFNNEVIGNPRCSFVSDELQSKRWAGLVILFDSSQSPDEQKKPRNDLVRILMENFKICCEEFSIEVTSGSLEWLYESRIRQIKYNGRREAEYRKDTSHDYMGYTRNSLCLDIDLVDGRVIAIDAFVTHNGYYSHEVVIDCVEINETQAL